MRGLRRGEAQPEAIGVHDFEHRFDTVLLADLLYSTDVKVQGLLNGVEAVCSEEACDVLIVFELRGGNIYIYILLFICCPVHPAHHAVALHSTHAPIHTHYTHTHGSHTHIHTHTHGTYVHTHMSSDDHMVLVFWCCL